MGWHAQPTAQVILDGVRIPSSRLLGNEEGIGFGIAMNGLNGGRLNIAASSLGGRSRRSIAPRRTSHREKRSVAS